MEAGSAHPRFAAGTAFGLFPIRALRYPGTIFIELEISSYVPSFFAGQIRVHHFNVVLGCMRLMFLKENKPILYNQMILNGTLQSHLVETNETANRRLEKMIPEMATAEGIDENLKSADQMKWVRRMNSIRHRAEETILSELIYS